MPRTGITAYDLLISCPGDVLQYADIVKEYVESFNHTLGCLNSAEIVTRHWATDSFPQSGDRPQELLNKQFIRDCDAAVAIFWTKFGTPMHKYGSGTEEEIEEMLSSGKQVFLYFVDDPSNPSVIDMEQYRKVIDFKEKYKGCGLYGLVKDESNLRKQFSDHLTMYFLPTITGDISRDITMVVPLLQILIKLISCMYLASSTKILFCRSSQSENSFGLAVFFFTVCFRCKVSFLKDLKETGISFKWSTGMPGVFFSNQNTFFHFLSVQRQHRKDTIIKQFKVHTISSCDLWQFYNLIIYVTLMLLQSAFWWFAMAD